MGLSEILQILHSFWENYVRNDKKNRKKLDTHITHNHLQEGKKGEEREGFQMYISCNLNKR